MRGASGGSALGTKQWCTYHNAKSKRLSATARSELNFRISFMVCAAGSSLAGHIILTSMVNLLDEEVARFKIYRDSALGQCASQGTHAMNDVCIF